MQNRIYKQITEAPDEKRFGEQCKAMGKIYRDQCENAAPYVLTVRSRIGCSSQIESESHIEKILRCFSVSELCDAIMHEATANGWRDFEVNSFTGVVDVPLRKD